VIASRAIASSTAVDDAANSLRIARLLVSSLDVNSITFVKSAIAESKTALAGSDVDAMNNAFERLQTASHKLAEVLYSQTAASGGESATEEQASSATAGADGESSSTASDDNVIDAEYVDVEDEQKK